MGWGEGGGGGGGGGAIGRAVGTGVKGVSAYGQAPRKRQAVIRRQARAGSRWPESELQIRQAVAAAAAAASRARRKQWCE